jgi:hypothetical protein
MAIRQTILQTKRSLTPNQNLPAANLVKEGEAVVNLSDGILFFSGVTGGNYTTNDNGTTGYFEVGSNLYELNLGNRIIGYEGVTNLSGKFLSGTTSGFTLANISDIAGVDSNSFVTGFSWNPNQLTITRNDGLPNLTVTLETFSALTVTGDVDIQGNISNSIGNVTIQDNLVVNGNLTVTGTTSGIDHNGLDGLQGGSSGEYYHTTQTIHDGLTASTNPSTSNPFATILDIAAVSGDTQQVKVSGNDTTPGFLEDKLSGGTNVTLTTLNEGGDEIVLIDVNDTFVTGFTYDNSNNFTVSLNDGTDLVASINTVTGMTNTGNLDLQGELSNSTGNVVINDNLDVTGSITTTGLTISNLGANRVVYTNGSGTLSTESGFEYDSSTDLLSVGDLNVTNASGTPASIGQGGLVIGSGGSPGNNPGTGDLVIHGNFTVYGTGTTIDTTELYVEDPTITLNYNPTGDTSVTSIGSGFIIQDGAGTAGNDAFLAIARMDTFTGGDNTEYTAGGLGVTNRSWFTELNDIVIRNTNTNSGAPDGVRLLAEFDLLDGGTY